MLFRRLRHALFVDTRKGLRDDALIIILRSNKALVLQIQAELTVEVSL